MPASPPPDGGADAAGGTEADLWAEVQPAAARRLLLAGLESFAERGYHATSTRHIAAAAGMSPAALYVHYRTKADLLFHISRLGHRAALRTVEAAAAAAPDPAAAVAGLVRDFTVWHARNRVLGHVVQYELKALEPDHHAEIVALRRRTSQVVRDQLRRGADSGAFTVDDVPGTALALLSLGIDVARWYSPAGGRTPEQLGALNARLALRMLTPV